RVRPRAGRRDRAGDRVVGIERELARAGRYDCQAPSARRRRRRAVGGRARGRSDRRHLPRRVQPGRPRARVERLFGSGGGAQVGVRLRKYLWILGTIGAPTPFIGLFGTVAGIMRSFRDLGIDVGSGGAGNTAVVMTGISEALITTAGGILVAVEAVVLYNYFQKRPRRLLDGRPLLSR